MSGHVLWRDVKEKFLRERALIQLKGLVDAYRAAPQEDEAEAIVNILHEAERLVDAFYPPDEEGDTLLENSSFGSPQAKAVIAAGRRALPPDEGETANAAPRIPVVDDDPADAAAFDEDAAEEAVANEVYKDCGA